MTNATPTGHGPTNKENNTMTDAEQRFQAECDALDEEWENRTAPTPEDIPEDTPSLELEGTIFDPNL